jgi:hypothetical protein
VTATLVQTITTTSGSETVTETRTAVTVSTPAPPTGATGNPGVAAKFIPTSVPKVAASSPSSESSGGLSGGAIGGIIAGVVVLLIVVVVAAFLIIRRLKRVEDIMESKRGSSSGRKSKTQSHAQQMEHYGRQLHSDVDDMQSVDPLMIAGTTNNNSTSATPQPPGSDGARGRADSTNGGFTPSPNMMFNFTDDRSRHASPDSNAGGGGGGYFDIPARHQNLPGNLQAARIRGSTDDTGSTQHQQHRPYAYTHWRQQSNASELSADGSENGANGVGSPLVGGGGAAMAGGRISELHGSGAYVELPGGGGGDETVMGGYASPTLGGGAAGAGVRSRSSSAASATRGGHGRRRSDGVQGLGLGQGQQGYGQDAPGLGLAPLDEAAEMHGYYGRPDQQAGQTAAGLDLMMGDDGVPMGGYQPEGPQGPPGSPPVRGP